MHCSAFCWYTTDGLFAYLIGNIAAYFILVDKYDIFNWFIKIAPDNKRIIIKEKLEDIKADLAKLRSEGAKGTLKKETGVIRWKRRDIARMLTVLNERKGAKK